jgi:hypothetical protein
MDFFSGELIDFNGYAITLKFRSNNSDAIFHLTNIHGPSSSQDKTAFTAGCIILTSLFWINGSKLVILI